MLEPSIACFGVLHTVFLDSSDLAQRLLSDLRGVAEHGVLRFGLKDMREERVPGTWVSNDPRPGFGLLEGRGSDSIKHDGQPTSES